MFTHLIDTLKGKHPASAKRSGGWPKARADHLAANPTCVVCGGTEKLEVHHIKPFHLHPDLELDPENFATLCESKKAGVNCHLWFGHLGNFRSWNTTVLADAKLWLAKKLNRPMKETDDAHPLV